MKNIVIGQINPAAGDIRGNEKLIEMVLQAARKDGAHIVVFPQFSLCGVPVHDLVFHTDFIDAVEQSLSRLEAHTLGLIVVIGTILKDGSLVHDGAVIFHNGREIGRQHVMAQTWELDGFCFGLLVGESFLETVSSTPDIVFHLVASAWNMEVGPQRMQLGCSIVSRLGSPYLFVNLVGGNDEWVFDGGSFLLNSEGNLVFQAESYVEGAFLVRQGSVAHQKSVDEQLYDALTLGVQDFVRKSWRKRAVVILSGDIGSAVMATLAVRALGADQVRAVLMASSVLPQKVRDEALQVANRLRIPIHIVPIDAVVDSVVESLNLADYALSTMSSEHIRCVVCSAMAKLLGSSDDEICLSAVNKTELLLGGTWAVGDATGALAPLGDLFAAQICSLASFINNTKEACILEASFSRGARVLTEASFDREALPPSPILDGIVQHIFVEGASLKETERAVQVPIETVACVSNKILRCEHGRRRAPCVLKIATQNEVRYPIVNCFRFSNVKRDD